MALIIILSLYGLFLVAWALCSLIIIFQMFKYQPISLTGWIAIILYFLIASSLLGNTWNAASPLIDIDSFSLPLRFKPTFY